MIKVAPIPNLKATFAVGVFFLVVNLVGMVYALRGIEPSASFFLLYYLGSALVVANWITADSRRLGIPGSVDRGWFLLTMWPLALPYHLFSTRRWRGVKVLAGLVALYLLTYGISLLFFLVARRAMSGR